MAGLLLLSSAWPPSPSRGQARTPSGLPAFGASCTDSAHGCQPADRLARCRDMEAWPGPCCIGRNGLKWAANCAVKGALITALPPFSWMEAGVSLPYCTETRHADRKALMAPGPVKPGRHQNFPQPRAITPAFGSPQVPPRRSHGRHQQFRRAL